MSVWGVRVVVRAESLRTVDDRSLERIDALLRSICAIVSQSRDHR